MSSGSSIVNFAPFLPPDGEVAISPTSCPPILPVHRLPVELLSKVFVELSEAQVDQFEHKSDEKYVPHLMAITAASVCKQWRAVARGTPDLWTSIYVGRKTRHAEALLDACIVNAGRRPLDLHCSSEKFLRDFCLTVNVGNICPSPMVKPHISLSMIDVTSSPTSRYFTPITILHPHHSPFMSYSAKFMPAPSGGAFIALSGAPATPPGASDPLIIVLRGREAVRRTTHPKSKNPSFGQRESTCIATAKGKLEKSTCMHAR